MKRKLVEWTRRYVPAELFSLAVTLASATLTRVLIGNAVVTALVATWSGNLAYFGAIFLTDVLRTRRELAATGTRYALRHGLENVRALVIEFGVAEVIDSFFVRPALMYFVPIWVGDPSLGVILGKLAADVTFYVPAIVGYELSKKITTK